MKKFAAFLLMFSLAMPLVGCNKKTKTPADKTPADKTPADKTPMDKTPMEKTPMGKKTPPPM